MVTIEIRALVTHNLKSKKQPTNIKAKNQNYFTSEKQSFVNDQHGARSYSSNEPNIDAQDTDRHS